MIAAATEAEAGVENLWKKGPSGGRHEHPDFGQYISQKMFKLFQAAAPYCWCDKSHWFEERRDKSWAIFEPCLNQYNSRRKNMLKAVLLLMLDESMSGWRPKTSRLGGLPNITFEPRKPIPIGTMFKNGVECISGMIVFQDIVQAPDVQAKKKFFDDETHLPGGRNPTKIGAHTAEVLRQVEGANVARGGWVGGDAWFGSVATAVEVKRRLGVHSTFIIKNNQYFFPMSTLFNVLKARHKEKPAGHWVVMSSEIAGVKLFAIAYAWSQRGISYFLSTCGKTTPCEVKYETHFEDAYGNTQYKEIDRPDIAHFLYEFLPLIDEHNKQRQNLLNLESCWPTKDCWFRLLTTLLGMAVVDMHRGYRNSKLTKGTQSQSDLDKLRIRRFSDLLCNKLVKRDRQFRLASNATGSANSDGQHLERISVNGSTTRELTARQRTNGSNVGTACHKMCFICRKYSKADGSTSHQQTTFWCKVCKMPLCKKTRAQPDKGREEDCVDEHLNSENHAIGCFGDHVDGSSFPKDQQVDLNPRMSKRRR